MLDAWFLRVRVLHACLFAACFLYARLLHAASIRLPRRVAAAWLPTACAACVRLILISSSCVLALLPCMYAC